MSTQIRFTATKQMNEALNELRKKFRFLSDAEIFKVAFSKFYYQEMGYDENGFSLKEQQELDEALSDESFEGPFHSAEDFIHSLK
mgnify:CR=1 FL=1